MSKISTIYDAVVTEVSGLFSGKTRIPNAYDITNNPVHLIKNGWGLTVGDSVLSDSRTVCDIAQDRTFTVIISEQVYRLDTDTTALDTTAKSILEDAKTLIEGMEASDNLGEAAAIDKVTFVGSGSLSLLGGAKSHFLTLEVSFSITYREANI